MKINSALIIDDELDICNLLVNFLKKKNIHVSYAMTLEDGIEKFNTINPQLLILDHNLPDGYGMDKIQYFKNENNSLLIIVISAMSNIKTVAIEKGADFFMEKPISFTRLTELIS